MKLKDLLPHMYFWNNDKTHFKLGYVEQVPDEVAFVTRKDIESNPYPFLELEIGDEGISHFHCRDKVGDVCPDYETNYCPGHWFIEVIYDEDVLYDKEDEEDDTIHKIVVWTEEQYGMPKIIGFYNDDEEATKIYKEIYNCNPDSDYYGVLPTMKDVLVTPEEMERWLNASSK